MRMAMLCAVICMATPRQGAPTVCVCSSVTHSLCGVSNLCASCLCAMNPRQMNTYIRLGGEDGLFMLESSDAGAHRLGRKKVVHIDVAKEKDTVVYLGGGPCMCT